MKKLLTRLAILLLSLALALVLGELAVRALDPFGISYYRDNGRYFKEAVQRVARVDESGQVDPTSRLFENMPHAELELRTFEFRTDGNGLRTSAAALPLEPRAPQDPGPHTHLRILCLGDSVTLAWGVNDEHSWVRVLEREGRAADGRPVEALNAGHLMYETVQQADLLAAWGPVLRPDVVCVMVITNDLRPTIDQFMKKLASAPPKEEAGRLSSRLRFRLSQFFRGFQGLQIYRRNASELQNIDERDIGSIDQNPDYPQGWPRVEAALDDLRLTCANLNAQLVVIDHTMPTIPDLARWTESRGVPRIDTAFSDQEWAMDIRNSLVDAHANALGNRIIAKDVLTGLAQLGLLAPIPDGGKASGDSGSTPGKDG